jgi:hypothetical protein
MHRQRMTRRLLAASSIFIFILIVATASGCAIPGYCPGSASMYYTAPGLSALTTAQFERGEPRPVLDAVGWVIGIPDKIILWDRRVANHNISPESEAAIAEYLALNELSTVKVRLNQYAPLDDWRRLRANTSVGFGWRYTLGTLVWVGETIFPGRVFGYDHFNPFSNTVHVFSDAPAIGLHEAAHARDFAERRYKGTYAALYFLPGAPLWHEAIATRDVFGYLEATGDVDAQAEAYRLLYPAYGTYVGDVGANVAPRYGLGINVGSILAGHAIGRFKAHQLEASREEVAIESDPWIVEPDLSAEEFHAEAQSAQRV